MAAMVRGHLKCLSNLQYKPMVMAYPPNVRLCARHKVDAKMTEVKGLPSSREATVVGSQVSPVQGPLL